ncbi:MAG: GNAT family N-acetyltransferase [Pseudomonadota bacterium]
MEETLNLSFRSARIEDADTIKRIVNMAYRDGSDTAGWSNEAHLISGNRIEKNHIIDIINKPNIAILVALSHDNIVASMCVEKLNHQESYLSMLAVEPKFQSRGIGRRMFAEIEEYSRLTFGAQTYVLEVITLRNDLILFYNRLGYQQTGQISEFPFSSVVGESLVGSLYLERMEKHRKC